jgi:hypothetical protein
LFLELGALAHLDLMLLELVAEPDDPVRIPAHLDENETNHS